MTRQNRARLVLLAGLALAGSAGAAAAGAVGAAVDEADRVTIASCLRDSTGAPYACIGAVAVTCARPVGSGERRREAAVEIACSRREAAAWRERLDEAARLLAGRLDPGQRGRLLALQRAFEGYTALRCSFAGEVQPPERAPVVQAGCELRAVAVRAIEVERQQRGQAVEPASALPSASPFE